MKIALVCALLLCLLLIVLSALVWFSYAVVIVKLMYSILCLLSGIALGSIGIRLWRDLDE